MNIACYLGHKWGPYHPRSWKEEAFNAAESHVYKAVVTVMVSYCTRKGCTASHAKTGN